MVAAPPRPEPWIQRFARALRGERRLTVTTSSDPETAARDLDRTLSDLAPSSQRYQWLTNERTSLHTLVEASGVDWTVESEITKVPLGTRIELRLRRARLLPWLGLAFASVFVLLVGTRFGGALGTALGLCFPLLAALGNWVYQRADRAAPRLQRRLLERLRRDLDARDDQEASGAGAKR